ncbi:hypothetical protein OTU49_006651 [Cherax quadricarinatus]|uniref:Uncharacterized protein n=1 Tax=Cherax quadricarinatus TaxID=27406 RepID=A0AAW0WLP9_CHEQU
MVTLKPVYSIFFYISICVRQEKDHFNAIGILQALLQCSLRYNQLPSVIVDKSDNDFVGGERYDLSFMYICKCKTNEDKKAQETAVTLSVQALLLPANNSDV